MVEAILVVSDHMIRQCMSHDHIAICNYINGGERVSILSGYVWILGVEQLTVPDVLTVRWS